MITDILGAIKAGTASEATPLQATQLQNLANDLVLLTQTLTTTTTNDTNQLIARQHRRLCEVAGPLHRCRGRERRRGLASRLP